MPALAEVADFRSANSLSRKLRGKRFRFFARLFERLPKPVRILDVGGTEDYWRAMGFGEREDLVVTLLNLRQTETRSPYFTSVAGDARDLSRYGDQSFDVVFSNSVIEHVGELADQRRMADEVRRVGRRYFVQTPNRYFPIEPHFLFPGFQFLPEATRVWLLGNYRLGTYDRVTDPQKALELVREIRLLSLGEFRGLFPDARFYRERFCGLTKSFIAYAGW